VILENPEESMGSGEIVINSPRESMYVHVKTSAEEGLGYHRISQNRPWLVDECSKLVKRRQTVASGM
jgi:hypothetical protein